MTTQTSAPAVAVPEQKPAAARRRRSEINFLSGLGHVFLLFWAILVLAPLVWTFLASFKTNEEIFGPAWDLPSSLLWDNWVRAWNEANVGRYFLNSVIVVAFSTFGTMLLG